MSFNVQGAVEVPLEVFAGLVTEMTASDLPEGVSPDAQDCVFVPGSVSSRPGLSKVFAAAFGNVTVTYAKSYVDPTGVIRNLYLTSDGKLWVENLTANPGVYTLLLSSTPGSYAKSITAFGREYIAISDGRHGTEAPLQYDGTNLDRVTQDGPGASASVSSVALPTVNMAVTGVPPTLSIMECDPADLQPGGYYLAINVFINGSLGTLKVGDQVTISGSSASFNGTWVVTQAYPGTSESLFVVSAYLPPGTATATGGTVTIGSGYTMQRANNVVTVETAAAHNLQVGYRAQIAGVPANAIAGGIASVKIANEDNPGIATITTNSPHGLVPGSFVTLRDIPGASLGSISDAFRAGSVVTVTMGAPILLAPGASVTISGTGSGGAPKFDGSYFVQQVISATQFTYLQNSPDSTADATGGAVFINWPIPDSSLPEYYEVVSAPSPTTFQVEVNYSDATWSGGGTVAFAWDGTFYVTAVPSSNTFQYQQYGPNDVATAVGTVTPSGQASPGIHQMQVMYLTRQGYVTKPSPPVTFVANGGQYISVSNIPNGPDNITARILAFTGANGAYFYYIPVPAQVNGQVVSTATQIDDNTTASVILDFSDNTLFAAVGINIPGNDLSNQITLDGALGFGYYGSRLLAYGQRNRVNGLLNMGFDGGVLPNLGNVPTGWTSSGTGGTIRPGHFGAAWQITTVADGNQYGNLGQSFYQDAYGAPLAQPNTKYTLRVWLQPSVAAADVSFLASMQSASGAFLELVSISGAQMSASGSYLEVAFPVATPGTIPADFKFNIAAKSTATAVNLLIDEMSLIYTENPYLDTILYGSYVNNPEGFDGVSGKFGPSTDTHKVMDFGVIRDTFYMLTEDPSGRIHETVNNGVTEPAGWQVNEIGSNCGVLSAFALTKSQADDSSASGGEEWLAWASFSGARIFGGDQPWKISQEIQPDWSRINPAANGTVWALNDPVARIIYFGLPSPGATGSNIIFTVDYRELDTPYEIAKGAPIHTSLSGKLIATDHTRKWCHWTMTMNGAALMYRQAGALSTVFFGGNGQKPGAGAGFGNVYTLDAAKLTDDDYGQIFPYYTTYFFVNHDAEMALGLGAHMKMLSYLTGQLSGVGNITITPLINKLAKPWPLVGVRQLSVDPGFDLEWAGGSAVGQRIAFKIASSPIAGTDNSFQLTKLVAVLKPSTHLPVRGAAA